MDFFDDHLAWSLFGHDLDYYSSIERKQMIKKVLKAISIPFVLSLIHFLLSDQLTRSFYLFFGAMIVFGGLIVLILITKGKSVYIGFGYLGFLALKSIVFMLLYFEDLETLSGTDDMEKIGHLIPLVISLFIEVFGLHAVLSSQSQDKPNKIN